MTLRTLALAVVLGAIAAPVPAGAQPLGTFRWQLVPFCNVVTLAVTHVSGVYRIEGTDDQCGAGNPASAVGTAFPRPDGAIGMGLSVVAAPSATPIHIEATLSLANFSGTWHDSAGFGGAFVLTPGAAAPGAPRPAGGLGGVAVTTVAAGAGLTGGGTAGTVNIAVSFAGPGSAVTVARSDHTHARGSASAENTAVGESALGVVGNALGNTAMGHQALSANATGSYNTAVGAGTLQSNVMGISNVAVGERALTDNQSGSSNVAVGTAAMLVSTSGSGNTALGSGTLFDLTSGADNVAIGRQALSNLVAGGDNIAIGALAGLNMSGGTNNIYIGNPGFAPDNNTIRIGDASHVGTIITGIATQTSAGGVPVLINGGGRMGTTTSSIRFKSDVTSIDGESRKLHDLRPVRFVYKPGVDDGTKMTQFGLIAEEVAESFPELLVRDERGEPWTVRYHLLVPLLVAEVQRLERERVRRDQELLELRERLDRLESLLDRR